MVKGLVIDSYPSVNFRILSKPTISLCPPANTQTIGQGILGHKARISQYVPMGRKSARIQKLLQLPEAEPMKVVEGYKEMAKNLPQQAKGNNEDFKAAAEEFLKSEKPISDDSYEPPKTFVTEKNEASAATAIASSAVKRVAKPSPTKVSKKKSVKRKPKKSGFHLLCKGEMK